MQSIEQLDSTSLRQVRGLFTDIDDTLSTQGKLHPEPYGALWRLREAGVRVVCITGRPAGWCDHIARFWPVDGVVGENGGLYFRHDGEKLIRRYLHDEEQRRIFRRKLEAVRERILREVPGAAVASDQLYREYDLAIDFCEDVPALPREQVLKIASLFEEAGATAKISSIHVNGWFGLFDKLISTKLFVSEQWGEELDREKDAYLYCGDSPNDEPMFEYFPLSFGMANVGTLLELMEHHPAYITKSPAGNGFLEVAEALLRSR